MAAKIKLLVTGCQGQLGSDLMLLNHDKYDLIGIDIDDLDLTSEDDVRDFLHGARPDVVINAAAYTAVDDCEKNREPAMKVNGDAPGYLAKISEELGCWLIHYSTDYVFDGTKTEPYVETDPVNPRTVYGESKLAGERNVQENTENYTIMRIAWLYGKIGKNFIRTMLKLGHDQLEKAKLGEIIEPLKIVNDQFGNPTWTIEVVRQTEKIIESEARGLFHATAEGTASWYDFARKIFELTELPVQVRPCETSEFPRPAPRPAWSVLENKRLKKMKINMMKTYDEALEEFLVKRGGFNR